jgi:hypothetical protein
LKRKGKCSLMLAALTRLGLIGIMNIDFKPSGG